MPKGINFQINKIGSNKWRWKLGYDDNLDKTLVLELDDPAIGSILNYIFKVRYGKPVMENPWVRIVHDKNGYGWQVRNIDLSASEGQNRSSLQRRIYHVKGQMSFWLSDEQFLELTDNYLSKFGIPYDE